MGVITASRMIVIDWTTGKELLIYSSINTDTVIRLIYPLFLLNKISVKTLIK